MEYFSKRSYNYTICGSELSMHADDHQLYGSGSTVKEVEAKLEHDVNITTRWYEENFFLPNGGSRDNTKYQSIVLKQAHGHINCKVLLGFLLQLNLMVSLAKVDLGKRFPTS